jgi:bloom syndrome protein
MRRPRGDGPAVRRKDHLQTVRGALDRWRIKKVMSDKYSETSFTPQAILPDPNLTTLASNARIRTVDDILSTVKPPWIFATRYGPEILALLTKLDSLEKDARTAKTIEKREKRKRQTAQRRAAKKTAAKQTPAPPLTGSSSYNTAPFTPARTPAYPWTPSFPPQLSHPSPSPIPYHTYPPFPSPFLTPQNYTPAQLQAMCQSMFIYNPISAPHFYYRPSPQ